MADLEEDDTPIGGPLVRPARGAAPGLGLRPTPPAEDAEAALRASLPLFAEGAQNTNLMIRCSWMDVATGQWNELGAVPSSYGIDEVLRQRGWGKHGAWRFQLVDRQSGRPVLNEMRVVNVDPNHRILMEMRSNQDGGSMSAPTAADHSAVDAMLALLREERAAMAAERERAQRMLDDAVQDRAAAAGTLSADTRALTEKLLDQRQADSSRVLEQTTSTFGNLLALMQSQTQAVADRERSQQELLLARMQESFRLEQARIDAQLAAERERLRAETESRRTELEREKERMAEERRERAAREERERAAIQAQADREAARMAEYHKQMAELYRREANPLEVATSAFSKVTEVAKAAGIDLPDLIKNIMTRGDGGGEAQGGIAGVIAALAPVGVEALKTIQKRMEAGVEDDVEEDGGADDENDPIVVVTMQNGTQQQMRRSEFEAWQAQLQQRALPGPTVPSPNIPVMVPHATPAAPAAPAPAPAAPTWLNSIPGAQPAPGAAEVATPPPVPAPPAIPDASTVLAPARLKVARRLTKQMVSELAALPEAERPGKLVATCMAHPDVRSYLEHVTIEGALTELGIMATSPDYALALLRQAGAAGLPLTQVWLAGVAR